MTRVLELFAGIGGGVLGAGLLGHRVIAAVEQEPKFRELLLRRQREGWIPRFPIWDDVRTFDGRPFDGVVDVVSAGFPCQPFSLAGDRRAGDDERNLWPDTIRVVREVRPRYVFLENTPGLVRVYLDRVLGDLASCGFDAEWGVLGAAAVGAPHKRDRLWILAAHPDRGPLRLQSGRRGRRRAEEVLPGTDGPTWHDSHTDRGGREGERGEVLDDGERRDDADRSLRANPWDAGNPPPEPLLRRVAHGFPGRLDRLRGLGNAQVPQCYAAAWRLLERRFG